jgi:TMEM175 potassium channel family protein
MTTLPEDHSEGTDGAFGRSRMITIGTSRLEAFSDGVMAVIITITALSLRTPSGTSFGALGQRLPQLLIYILSFTFVGIYWNNHHHLLRATHHISAGVMWSNLHLLFWLSLIPFVTQWVGAGDNHSAHWPAATYGIVALGAAIAFEILVLTIIRANGRDSAVARATGSNLKGHVSIVCYAAGVGFAFLSPYIAYALYALVAVMWFVPDRQLAEEGSNESTEAVAED